MTSRRTPGARPAHRDNGGWLSNARDCRGGGPGGRRVGGQVSEVGGVRSGQLDSKVSGLTSKREKR